MARRPSFGGGRARPRGREAPHIPPARDAVRGRKTPANAAAPSRRRPRRHRPASRGRRADERAREARRLPRREPLHDMGVQVRAPRSGRKAPPPRLAGSRDPARAGFVGRIPQRRDRPDGGDGAGGAPLRGPSRDRRRADDAPATGPGGARAERRPDRRAVRAPRHDQGRALYKTLHDARRKLRRHLEATGYRLDGWEDA